MGKFRDFVMSTEPKADYDTAYYCISRLGGVIPKVGPVHHASVAICPMTEPPAISGKSNPSCVFMGTQPNSSCFQVEPQGSRRATICTRAALPANVVRRNISAYHKPYSLIRNNCKHAAKNVTGL